MKRALAIAAALFLLLTFLFVQTMPNLENARAKRDISRNVVMRQTMLQKLILSARAGLLANDDPIVQSLDELTAQVQALQRLPDLSPTTAAAIDRLADLVGTQGEDVFDFTAKNAILRNSLAYFAFFVSPGSGAEWSDQRLIRNLATSMINLTVNETNAAQQEVRTLLDELNQRVTRGMGTADDRAVVAHGRVIASTLPVLDDLLRRMGHDDVGQQAARVQDILAGELEETERAMARGRAILYAVALLLLGLLLYLYSRLQRNAHLLDQRSQALAARLTFEQIIVGLSNMLVGIPAEHVDRAIGDALGTIARRLQADRIYFRVDHPDYGGRYFSSWPVGQTPAFEAWAMQTAELRDAAPLQEGVARVDRTDALPAGPLRAALESQHVQAWLAVPVTHQSIAVGILGIDRSQEGPPWPRENLGLLRMVGDILLQALSGRHATAQRDALTGRLHHAQRVQAIGTIASGVAHNFNNILGAIMGYAEMALEGLKPGSKSAGYIAEVQGSGRRATDLVDQILRFSRQGDRQRREIDIVALLQETGSLLRVTLPKAIELRLHTPDEPILLLGDPTELQQVVINLANNAAQATTGPGFVEITLTIEVFTETRTVSHGRLPAEAYVKIAVTDQGTGMDDATKARLFEPFFTRKAAGTGLGLATIFAIVSEHGGGIDVTSELGQGTRFEIYLPRNPTLAVASAPEGIDFSGDGQVIAIVDDEAGLLHLCEEFVAAIGCEPVGFLDPLKALAAIEADPRRFDLLLTDEIMPRMRGVEFATRAHRLAPDMPIVLMTGLLDLPSIDLIREAGIEEIARKPLLAADMRGVLARQLHKESQVAKGTEAAEQPDALRPD